MKAAVCREFGKPLVIEDIDIAAPGAEEIKVKLAACAICHSDIHFWEGAWGGTLPAVYGHEAAGIVAEAGSRVAGFAVGDPVVVTLIRSCGRCFHCAQGEPYLCEGSFELDRASPLKTRRGETLVQGLKTGAFAEYVVVHASQAAPVPQSLPLDSASLLACGVITGVGAVINTAAVRPGSSVVVIGTGGVGLNCVQGAAIAGANPIVAVDLSDAKLKAATAFGATHGLNPARDDVKARVAALTQGRRADTVLVAVGAKAAIEQGLGLIRRGGSLVVVGMPASGVLAQFDPGWFASDGQRILGSKMGSTRLAVDIANLVRLHQQGRLKLDPLISGRYPLERINEAIQSVVRGDALRNVIVF